MLIQFLYLSPKVSALEQSCLAYIVLYTANKILQNQLDAYAILKA